jgi:hypothetical protein
MAMALKAKEFKINEKAKIVQEVKKHPIVL